MTWKLDIFRSGQDGSYLVDSGFFAQRRMQADMLHTKKTSLVYITDIHLMITTGQRGFSW